jgi:hypothetical protein
MRGERGTSLWQTERHDWWCMIGVCFYRYGNGTVLFLVDIMGGLGSYGFAHAQGAGTG